MQNQNQNQSQNQNGNQNQPHRIGVDLAKSGFVADLPKDLASFAQIPAGLRDFLAQLPANVWVVCEATGGYPLEYYKSIRLHYVPGTPGGK
jgi:transposase